MKKVSLLLFFPFLALCFLILGSCKKEEGQGGKFSIKGKVIARYYDKDLYVYTGTRPAADVEVYLVYGDQAGYGEKTVTRYDGAYEFKYLQKGEYTIYMYSKDTTYMSQSLEIPVVLKVSISGDTDVPDITIAKEDKRDTDIGPYKITGKISAFDCDATFTNCSGPYNAIDAEVYLIRGTDDMYSDKVNTYFGGRYTFSRLPNGNYTVYVVSDNENYYNASYPQPQPKDTIRKVDVVINGADVDAGELIIVE